MTEGRRDAVFVFARDETVNACPSIDAARRGREEAVDIADGEYDFVSEDGRVIDATAYGRAADEYRLRLTDELAVPPVTARLRSVLPVMGLPSLSAWGDAPAGA